MIFAAARPTVAAMSEPAHSHKPTTKHVNKPFKSRTATKGDLKKTSKGRTQKLKARSSAKAQESKASRKNKAKQLQRAKANKVEVHAPRVVAVLSLCSDANPTSALASIVPADTIFEQSGIHYAQ
jgi:pre-rRNA-processing protein TSR1